MPRIWGVPPELKVFEALGAVADGRVQEQGMNSATVVSSDGSKRYTVSWDPDRNLVSSNDNASYWQGYLGYPAIAYLMSRGQLPFDAGLAARLAALAWKTLNAKLKQPAKVMAYLQETRQIDIAAATGLAESVRRQIAARAFLRPDRLPFPPKSNGKTRIAGRRTEW
jgi:hypothetical protein